MYGLTELLTGVLIGITLTAGIAFLAQDHRVRKTHRPDKGSAAHRDAV